MTQDTNSQSTGEALPGEPDLAETSSIAARGAGGRLLNLLAHPKAPLIVGALFFLGLGWFVVDRLNVQLPSVGRPDIVVFDPVRFQNAQRAAASILAANPSADISLTLTQVAKHAEAVIKEEAGGSVVLVKQAVVVPDNLPDITDAVLERFGLPTSVPTVRTSVGDDIESVAPSDSVFSDGKLREDYRLELQQRTQAIQAEQQTKNQQQQVLP